MIKDTNQPNTESLFKFITFFLRPYPFFVFLFIITAMLPGVMMPLMTYMTKKLVDLVNLNDLGPVIIKKIAWIIASIATIFFIELSSWRIFNLIRIKTVANIKNKITDYCMNYVHQQSYHYFQNTFSGSILRNITRIVDKIEFLLFDYTVDLIKIITLICIGLFLMFCVSPIYANSGLRT